MEAHEQKIISDPGFATADSLSAILAFEIHENHQSGVGLALLLAEDLDEMGDRCVQFGVLSIILYYFSTFLLFLIIVILFIGG
jgi:hypothetical protein